MQDELFKTRYSKYGYGIDVRRTYKDLPCQPFWTWVTGKSLNDRPPRRPKDTLLKPWQLYLHISWGYAVFFLAVIYGQQLLASQQPLWLKCLLGALIMCLVVNRQRGFLHTFHYTTHGASLENKALARFTCKWILSIPILHTPRDEYVKLHVNEHHSVRTFNTEHDVDLVFMKQHGFYKGMSESAFWTRLVLAPFHPARILEHLKFRFDVSFVSAPRHERVSRALYWAALLGLVYASGYLEAFALFYLFPIFILTQYSSWIQHVSEHLWFARNEHGLPRFLHYGSLSWGRFLGRPYPADKQGLAFALAFVRWSLGVLLIDIPLRVFSFMQDLPSHDFHHRKPGVNFWRIAPERAANEARPSKFGPMTETWGMWENFLILRDHLCRGQSDPFGIVDWYRENHARLAPETDAANQPHTNPHPRLPPDHTGNPMNTQIAQITQSLAANGCAYITPSDALYDEQDWELMNQVLANSTLPWEKILIGDADEENDLYVARFMTDRDRPTVVNHALSELIIPRVCNDNVMSLFRKLMGDDAFYVRRMQVNRMKAGSFIGRHLDTDSNPDYQYSIVLQLGTYFSGGQFVVYDRDGNLRNDIKPEPRSVIISDCSYPHEVQQVTAGERVSLVFFVSRHADRNRRVY